MAITLTHKQQEVFDQIVEFLADDNDDDTFILKGYAGTGKTTLAGFITQYLEENELQYIVMAPTGRAAKVISDKVGSGRTIHSCIYKPRIECHGTGSELPYKSYSLYMGLRTAGDIKAIIIDESSMISDKKDKDNFFKTRGTLLEDLFDFARISEIPKIIFIGDDAQLPPVSCAKSYALDADYLREEHDRKVEVAILSEVLRQKGDSGILKEATEMRESLKDSLLSREHTIKANNQDIEEIGPWFIPQKFIAEANRPSIGKCVVISYTNRFTSQRNEEIRTRYFGEEKETLEIGDIILVCNNTTQNNRRLYNGDFAQITSLGSTSKQFVKVLDTEDNKIKNIKLQYREATIRQDEEDNIDLPIILLENFIQSNEGQLPDIYRKALYINFCKRHPELLEGSEDFSKELMKDQLFNCVHAKYGYAITCHKSQGGEWDTVFVDYSDRNEKNNEDIRWAYTATTRARKKLYIINPPHNKPM